MSRMKSLVVLCLLAAAVHAYPHEGSSSSEGSSEEYGLTNFDKTALDSDMLAFNFPADLECDGEGTLEEANSCVKEVHVHAKQCIKLMHADEATHNSIVTCETDNADVKAADQAWQEASQKYHVQMGKCLRSEDPEEEEVFYFRRKRHTEHGHSHSSDETYENVAECWKALNDHKIHCVQTMNKCPRIALCGGMLPEEPEEDAEWHNIMKDLAADKQQKVQEHKWKLNACLGGEPQVHWHEDPEEPEIIPPPEGQEEEDVEETEVDDTFF